jgi:hypothetical protein
VVSRQQIPIDSCLPRLSRRLCLLLTGKLRLARGAEAGTSSLEKLAREAKVNEAFVSGLEEIVRQGRDAVAGHTSREYGPSLIAELPAVKKEGIRKKELSEAMTRLLAENKIHIGLSDDMPSRAKKCLFPGASHEAPPLPTYFQLTSN